MNEESFFVSLVCKKWLSLIKRSKHITITDLVIYYMKLESISALNFISSHTTKSLCRFIYKDRPSFTPAKSLHYSLFDVAKNANKEVLNWVIAQSHPELLRSAFEDICGGAAYGCRYDILEWARNQGYESKSSACWAAEGGHMELVKSLVSITDFVNGIDVAASKGGHLKILQWITERTDKISEKACCVAAECGHWDVVKWLITEKNNGLEILLCREASLQGNLEMVQWLRAQKCPWDESVCAAAAEKGHLEILVWLRENGCTWDNAVLEKSAMYRHFKLLQWARANGCPWSSSVCSNLACNGDLEMLKWVRGNGCPWDENTCTFAAAYGNLEVLKWASGNGCPWSLETSYAAKFEKNKECFTYAIDNGCPWDDRGYETYKRRRKKCSSIRIKDLINK